MNKIKWSKKKPKLTKTCIFLTLSMFSDGANILEAYVVTKEVNERGEIFFTFEDANDDVILDLEVYTADYYALIELPEEEEL